MKVLEVNVDDNGMGGVFALVRNVILNKPEEIKLDIACIAPFERQEHVDEFAKRDTNVFYIGTKNRLFRPIAYYRKLKRLIEENQYDIVHIHGDVAYLLLLFAKAAKAKGVDRVILHSHAAGVDGRLRLIKKGLHNATKYSLKGCGNAYVACSNLAGRWMYPWIPSEDVVMIHNGINLKKFEFDSAIRQECRKKLCIEPDEHLIGHVGRFAYQKNHEFLIKMFCEVRKNNSKAKLLLVGEGVLMEKIRELTKTLGVEESVIFYGASSSVYELMQAMDCFVLPSHFEGLPVVGVEAQAIGLPTIFSDKITKEAKILSNVYFLPIHEDSKRLWSEKISEFAGRDSNRLDANECVKVAGFSIENTISEFLKLYDYEMITRERGPR